MQVINPKKTIFYSIEKTIKTYRQYAQRCINAQNLDITIDQQLVLRAIQDYEGISQTQIGEMIFKDYASVTRMINLLVNKGYLERSYHSEDRRRHQLAVTPEGLSVIEKLNPIVAKYRKDALGDIKENELDNVRTMLERITQNCLDKNQ